jgi:DNA-binding SARP family transcriptional activator
MDTCDVSENTGVQYPLLRIFTLGEFAIERLIWAPPPEANGSPQYAPVAPHEWDSRGPAMTLLKVLLCRPDRRAIRSGLIRAIWPNGETLKATHALDSAASVLRRRILQTPGEESLLLTLHSGGETIFRLPGQRCLWVDADELLGLAARAIRMKCQGHDPLPLLEAAYALARGNFLEDDLYVEWAQGRRHTIEGARHRVLYQLVDIYLERAQSERAEALLFAELERDPTDEDALCCLMVLLARRGRRREAIQLYQYAVAMLQDEQSEPAVYTQNVAARIRGGLVVRERTASYTIGDRKLSLPVRGAAQPALTVVAPASTDGQSMWRRLARTSVR